MIKEAIVKIVNKEDLSYDEAYAVMNEIMSGETTPTQNAAFLAALSTKSARAETTDEIAGCAAAMRAHATKVQTDMELFEIVGTGGDNAHSFNISTTSALVAASGGMKVAKHGNRAASSQCGTADCLEALGVNIQQSPNKCIQLLKEVGMCFFFAQKYHASMKYVGAIRKELGFRTVFNILGPLTNPGLPSMQLLGVYDDYLVKPLAQVLINLATRPRISSGMTKFRKLPKMLLKVNAIRVNHSGTKRPNTMPSAIARSTLGSKPNLCFIRCRFIGFRLDDSCVGALGRSCSRFGPNSFFGGPVACRFSINV